MTSPSVTAIISMVFVGLMSLGIFACFILWVLTWTGVIKQGGSRRGFEVKLNTGQSPVEQEENETE